MALEIRVGDRGPAALWDGKFLTSVYGPEREAQGWADRAACSPGSLVFVAGDPWGLASQALAGRGVRAVALLPGSAARARLPAGVEAWAPEEGALEDFLQDVFETTGPEAVVWEVWPAFERHAPEVALDWGRRFRDLFRTVQGSWLTQRRFGTRFWRNALRNYLGWETPVQLIPGQRPIVIAASGPSLNDGLETLVRHRGLFDLWALPSSFETLDALSPDAGVATDGGFYAREHLQRLSRSRFPLLAALSSAPDPVLAARPCLFFSQGQPLERALLAGPAFTEVPSQGTVAVTALRLALRATTGPVFIAGLDLSFRGVRGHARPHTVDRREQSFSRLRPAEAFWSQTLFEQATVETDGVRTSPALLTYAGWFRTRARFERPVYRIAPSPLRWDSMREVSWSQAADLWKPGQPVTWRESGGTDSGQRADTALRVLNELMRRAETAADDPWLVDAARTAVPEALARDFRARRRGERSDEVRPAFLEFLAGLRKEIT